MYTRIICALFLLGLAAYAQSDPYVSGISVVWYDQPSAQVISYSGTVTSPDVAWYYDVRVEGFLFEGDNFGSALRAGWSEGNGGTGGYLTWYPDSVNLYTVVSNHYLRAYFVGWAYYDPFGFSLIASNPDWGGGYWFGTTVYAYVATALIFLGQTAHEGMADPNNISQFWVSARAFIPYNYLEGPPDDVTGQICGLTSIFEGDDRGPQVNPTRYRTMQGITLVPDQAYNSPGYIAKTRAVRVGQTNSFASDAVADNVLDSRDYDNILNDCHLWHGTGWASTSNMQFANPRRESATRVAVDLAGNASNPLVFPSSSIDWAHTVRLEAITPFVTNWALTVSHDCFPAHEVQVGSSVVYSWMPTGNSLSTVALCLGGMGSITDIRSGTIYR